MHLFGSFEAPERCQRQAGQDTAVPSPALTPTPAAILFADIVGFTRLSERMEPGTVFEFLAAFHRRADRVLGCHDVLFMDAMGDGIMAVWQGGAISSERRLALRGAFALLDDIRRWDDSLTRRLDISIRLGAGLHTGNVMIARTGAAAQGKLSAFGDAVNVASRLERMTRRLNADLVVSENLFAAVVAATPWESALQRFSRPADVTLPGRVRPLQVRSASTV